MKITSSDGMLAADALERVSPYHVAILFGSGMEGKPLYGRAIHGGFAVGDQP